MSDGSPSTAEAPAVGDHYRPADAGAPVEDGVYRVVGTGDETVTLLRVGDAEDRRVHSGRVVSVPLADLSGFDPAENPDGNRSPGAAVAGVLDSLYWQLRTFAASLAARPLPATAATAVLLLGWVGDDAGLLSDGAATALALVGGLALAYVGSRGA